MGNPKYNEYYMRLPDDRAGSRTKNRFRVELLWGISELIDAYKQYDDYTVVFDFKCDIELHYESGLNYYQIKTKNKGNHSYKSLTGRQGASNSILGKLYALYNPEENIKLAVVCNKHLKVGKEEDVRPKICLGTLDEKQIDDIEMRLKEELAIEDVNLDRVFYICDGIDLMNPQHALLGKLVESFEEIKEEEPVNPNALYRLVSDTAQRKASFESNIDTYGDVLVNKGISRKEFDRMLENHRKTSITGLDEVKKYIKGLPLPKQRPYSKALGELMDNADLYKLQELKKNIFDHINSNINKIDNEKVLFDLLGPEFDDEFPVEFTAEMKEVFYLRIFYIYQGGGEIS